MSSTAKATPPPDGGWIPTWLASPNVGQLVDWIDPCGSVFTGMFLGGWFLSRKAPIKAPIAWRPAQ